MACQEFTTSPHARRRYWARSHLGRRTFGRARPNAGHRAVTAFGRHGLLSVVITGETVPPRRAGRCREPADAATSLPVLVPH